MGDRLFAFIFGVGLGLVIGGALSASTDHSRMKSGYWLYNHQLYQIVPVNGSDK